MSSFSFPTPDRVAYEQAQPFPHAVIHGAWDEQTLRDCKSEILAFSDWDGEKDFYGALKKRYCADIDRLPPTVQKVIADASSPRFLAWLEELTGEKNLMPDPYLEGGGIHQIAPGGFLKVHADFNWNERLKLYRRLNVLVYLNDDWDDSWGGLLELWTTDMKECHSKVPPTTNTMVVFTTDDQSFHGLPHPLASPEGVNRDSIALYYYSPIRPEKNFAKVRLGTDYRPVGGDTFKVNEGGLLRRLASKLSR